MPLQSEDEKTRAIGPGRRASREIQQITGARKQLGTVVETYLRLRVKSGHRHALPGFGIDQRTGIIAPPSPEAARISNDSPPDSRVAAPAARSKGRAVE